MLLTPASRPFAEQVRAQDLPTIREKIAHMESQDGFIPIHFDPADGRLYLEVALPGEEFFYNSFMATGAGLALARGHPNWMASETLVRFERRGAELVLLARNIWVDLADPERTDVPAEDREPFRRFLPESFPVVAEEGERVLVDGTDHFLQDVYGAPREGISGVPWRLRSLLGEGGFQLDLGRSSIFRPSTRATPESTEVEALLTFVTDQPGEWAKGYLPDSITLVARERHSLSRLPEPVFPIRHADARMGFNTYPFSNPSPASSTGSRIEGVTRWRLEKLDPATPVSEVVEPIAVYLDAEMPELIREAARLGIQYWNQVFETIGFRNAIMIRDLPPDADPLDPRFPFVVLWRPAGTSSGGMYSQGFPVVDTRTGEIVRAIILLAGYRERVERNTYRAIETVLESGQPDLESFLLAGQASVVAHEAGHALAFLVHNDMVPSMMGMLRPRLRVGPSAGLEMDLSVLYPPKPFPYDEWMMRYAYAPFEPGQESEGLLQIVEDGLRGGLMWGDTRAGLSNPRAAGRIYSDDPLTVLEEDMAVRRLLLERFGSNVLHPGEPESLLFERFIPVYFHHRHSLRAVVAMVGGVEFAYEPASNYQRVERVIDSRTQRQALDALMDALSPEELLIPSRIAAIIPPRLESSPVSELEWPVREPGIFQYMTDAGPIWLPLQTEGPFNPLGWVGMLSNRVVRDLLRRMESVAEQHGDGQTDLSVEEILNRIIQGTWGAAGHEDPQLASVRRIVRDVTLRNLLGAAEDEGLSPEVRGPVRDRLRSLLEDLQQRETDDPVERAHLDEAIQRIAGVGLGEAR
jgi:hypothetical protein